MCSSVVTWMVSQLETGSCEVHPSTISALESSRENAEALREALMDGCILCQLANAMKPKCIKKFNKRKNNKPIKLKFKRLENIQKFADACRYDFELPDVCIFASSDLESQEGMASVLSCLHGLERISQTEQQDSSRNVQTLVDQHGYADDEECFWVQAGEVQGPISLLELRSMYASAKIQAECQVSFGEDWFPASKWLGPRQPPTDGSLAWKHSGVSSTSFGRQARASTLGSRASRAESVLEGACWYFQDLDHVIPQDTGPYTLEQMQDWFAFGKIQPYQEVWFEEEGTAVERKPARDWPELKDDFTAEVQVNATTPRSAPPPVPMRSSRSRSSISVPNHPPRQPTVDPQVESIKSSANVEEEEEEEIEYRRGMLSKFARGRKRHSSGTKYLSARNWQKRFFVLHGNKLEYFASRSKFIRRDRRSGGFDLGAGDSVVMIDTSDDQSKVKDGKYHFELQREGDCILKMYADDRKDRQGWIAAIRQCIADATP